jgi:hypothetical protein
MNKRTLLTMLSAALGSHCNTTGHWAETIREYMAEVRVARVARATPHH